LERRQATVRTHDELKRAVRSIARHFGTDTVYLIGSQAILVSWPDAPVAARLSQEIDAYPANADEWQRRNDNMEASEEINALFGFGSAFHVEFGFYIDGVDSQTAAFPLGWKARAVQLAVQDGERTIIAIAPALDDLIAAKSVRLDEKDKDFTRACHLARPLDHLAIRRLIDAIPVDRTVRARAKRFLDSL
jgi:hypothetical protein